MTLDAILLVASFLSPATAERYAAEIDAASARHRLDPLLFVALIYKESRFRRHASSKNNYGLVQIRVSPTNHREYLGRERELFDARTNIRLAAALLAYWRRHHRTRCAGGHHWWSHYQWGRRVRDRGSGDRVADTLRRIRHALQAQSADR